MYMYIYIYVYRPILNILYLLCQVTVLGTPAEEGCLGGKIDLINAGAFSDIDCAMTAHPFPYDIPRPLKFALRM